MSMLLVTIGRLRPGGEAALVDYATNVLPLLTATGGVAIARGRLIETVVGADSAPPDLVAVIRFPDADVIRRFLASPDYRAHVRSRDAAFEDVRSWIASDLMDRATQ
jgi:uncharacterized protein (DUF1330 family)